MDIVVLKNRIKHLLDKYKYVGIILLAGIVLMMLPSKATDLEEPILTQDTADTSTESLEERTEQILSCVKGAGRVKVLLSIAKGESSVYQTDSTYSQGDTGTDSRTQTIIITDSSRNEEGLIYQKNPPIYQGAIVLAQGADNPSVKLAIVEALMDITGLGADKISVLKMQ